MNKKLGFLALCASSFSLYAGTVGEVATAYPWFASIGTGYSWTERPGIVNSDPSFWDPSSQGYDANIGNRGFYSFAIGKQIYQYIDVSLSYINNEVFHYQKFQSSPGLGNTPGFTGNARNRFFNLNNRAVLANAFLHSEHALTSLLGIDFTPFAGAGVGVAHNQVLDFYTVGTTNVAGVPIGSSSSIGGPTTKDKFAWQASVGLNFRPVQSHLSVDAGYRYYDGGIFNGPATVYSNTEGFSTTIPWSGRLKANQIFVEFKYTT